MNDPRRPQRYGPPQPGPAPTWPQGPVNPSPVDPAYAGQAPYAPTYSGHIPQWAPSAYEANPTQQLPPQYWQLDHPEPGGVLHGAAPPPHGPSTPRWLWVAAGAAVLLVVALVIALVIANMSVKNQTAVEPLPPMPTPSSTLKPPTPRTLTPTQSIVPAPTTTGGSGTPTETPAPGAMQTVVYNVTGEGRAISVTYTDTGDVIQTEFNVALPWSKEVSLPKSSLHPASVTIINIGHNVTCSVTVAGVQVRQRTGVGLTICDASG